MQNRREGRCGLCGTRAQLTKTHVPPQAAGNTGAVERWFLLDAPTGTARRSPMRSGGLWFRSLCSSCNSLAGGRWDAGLAGLHAAIGPVWTAERLALPAGYRHSPRSCDLCVGAAARSMLVSAFALNPKLRSLHPDVAKSLLSLDPVPLPDGLRLSIAWAIGRAARVTGSIGGFYIFGPRMRSGRPLGAMCFAQAHFPPLAWRLAVADEDDLVERQGWADVTDWLLRSDEEAVPLATACPPLPPVSLPRQDPQLGWQWTEMYSNEAAFIVECDDVTNGALNRKATA